MTSEPLDLTLALDPIQDAQWPEEIADMLEGFAGKLNIYRVMAHDPALLRAWTGLRGHVVLGGALTDQQREIVILRVGYRWGAAYEWAHHVSRGRLASLSEAQIAAAATEPNIWTGGSPDEALMAAVDSLLQEGRLPPAVLADLRRSLTAAGVLDLMATVGMYTTLAFIAKTFQTPIEDDLVHLAPDWPT